MQIKKVLAVFLACLVLAGCNGVDPNSPLGKRKAIFKQMLHTSEDLGGMLRERIPFNAQQFASGAQHLDELAQQPWQHFPTVKEEDQSSARDDVWLRQERFQQLVADLESATAALVVASSAPQLTPAQLKAPMQQVEDACKGCHKEFRIY